MYVIGFAQKMFTLWSVTNEVVQISKHARYNKTTYRYLQNLADDLERAKSKVDGEYYIDLSLSGSKPKNFSVESRVQYDDCVYQFGKFRGMDIRETHEDDADYLLYYFNKKDDKCNVENLNIVADVLTRFGYYIGDDSRAYYSIDDYTDYQKHSKFLKYVESCEDGYHFDDGERLNLNIKQYNSFSFEGAYGTSFVMEFVSDCGKKLKYVGSSPTDISDTEFVAVKATIKHNIYRGKQETRLTRLKLQ